jgi:type I restriction enzyme, S subunit
MVSGESIDWPEVILEDVCSKITVGHVSRMADQYLDDGIPFLRSQNIKPFGLDLSDVKFISASFHHKLRKSAIHPGDVVIVRTGYPGTAAVVPPVLPVANCADLVIVRPGSALHPWFLAALLNSVYGKGFVSGVLVGAAQQHFNVGAARRLKFRLPPSVVQDRIASILSAYDDLIANNTRRIAILEEMARALYQEWFVHFRFPGHEHVPLVNSPLGPIPEGWEIGKLEQYVELAYGKALKADHREEGPFPVYGSSGIVGYHSSSLVDGPSIIVGRKGNVGSVHWSDEAFYPIDTVYYVKSELPLHYIYFNLMTQNFINNDAAVPGLNRKQAYSLPLLVPTAELLASFQAICETFFESHRNLRLRNENLRTTRDLLLPKLISGEIDVSALPAEPIAEAAD